MLKNYWLFAGVFLLLGCAALSQETAGKKYLSIPALNSARPLRASALTVSRDGVYPSSTVHLSGDVEIVVPMCFRQGAGNELVCQGEMALTGDNVTLHEDTGEIEANGTVRVVPLRPIH